MSTIKDLLPDTHFLKEKTVLDVHYNIGTHNRKETITFPNDINKIVDNFIPYEFTSPSGIHLYGLVRNPLNGIVHAYIDEEERDRELVRYKDAAARIADEEALDDGTEWRAAYSSRASRNKKYPKPDEYVPKPIVYHNALETNRKKH